MTLDILFTFAIKIGDQQVHKLQGTYSTLSARFAAVPSMLTDCTAVYPEKAFEDADDQTGLSKQQEELATFFRAELVGVWAE